MQSIKVMTIVGTRPEIIKLSRVIHELDQYTNHILVHTGQNFDYELNEIFFKDLEIRKPNYFLSAANANLAKTIGQIIIRIDEVLEKEKPDAVLIYGDTNSGLSVLAAKRRKIPIFHMEAGNRCFNQCVPEEINRKVIDHISDINLTLSEHARRYLILEGLRPETVIKVGSSMKEVFTYYKEKIVSSNILEKLNLTPKNYFVVSTHREENVDSEERISQLLLILNELAKTYNKRVIVSTHPRTHSRLESLKKIHHFKSDNRILFLKPFGLFDYAKLQAESFCVISDSGSLTEDASILNFPAVMIRETHERPEGMDLGVLIMSGLNVERVIQAVEMTTKQFKKNNLQLLVPDYDVDNLSQTVVRIILSYIDYVNNKIWNKPTLQNETFILDKIANLR